MNIDHLGSEAGQEESLVSRLKGLIRDYPAGIGIIKEFIQNADDAGATWVNITLDRRIHPAHSIPDQRMGPLLGSALIVESDQTFTGTDLVDIQQIGEGGKLREVLKTGRFGLGFNTAYNVTDYPSFATLDRILCFDPHRDAVAGSSGRPGRQWLLKDLWAMAPDWPRAFGIPEGQTHIGTTVFRLPLRTKTQAAPGRIADVPFLPSQVEAILQDLGNWGGTLLLFLRNIMHIEAKTISAKGAKTILASVQTANLATVSSARARLVSDESVADRVEEVYEHHFLTSTNGEAIRERWLVSGVLVNDLSGELLNASKDMAAIHEKTLALSGAAMRLDGKDAETRATIIRGLLFCTLPLPDVVPLPFHLNGYFDLDSSRSQITHGEALRGNVEIRARWNIALMKNVAASAVAHLLRAGSQLISSAGLATYYDSWPDLAELPQGPLLEFGKSFYSQISQLPCILTRAGTVTTWVQPAQVRLPPPSWPHKLTSACIEDGLPLPEPGLSGHVIAGLGGTSKPPRVWSPAEIRRWLALDEPAPFHDCLLEDAPRACLKVRLFVEHLLRFCNDGSPGILKRLPLALCSDGRLRRFGDINVFLGSAEMRSLFRDRQSWFVDFDLGDKLHLTPDPKARLYEMDVVNCLGALAKRLSPEASGFRTWEASGSGVPNEEWLIELIQWMNKHLLPAHDGKVRTVAFLPDQFGRLFAPGTTATPLVPSSQISEALRSALTDLRVSIASGSEELMFALAAFRRKHADLIWEIAASDVIDSLVNCDPEISPTTKSLTALLKWFSEAHAIEAFDDDRAQKLKDLKIWPTQNGNSVKLTEPQVFLATAYKVPDGFGRVILLSIDSGPQRALALDLGAQELSLGAYIEKVFLPGYEGLDPPLRLAALRWMRDNWPSFSRSEGSDGRLLKAIARSYCLIASPGVGLRRGPTLYSPDAKDALILLGPLAALPDFALYHDDSAKWQAFFHELGVRRDPSIADLACRVDQLVCQFETTPASVAEMLLAILMHLSSRWNTMTEVQQEKVSAEFSEREWLPALPSKGRRSACFLQPPRKLFRPSDIYPHKFEHLLASQVVFLPKLTPPLELQQALNMPEEAPPSLVWKHFSQVSAEWRQAGADRPTSDAIRKMSVAICEFVARTSDTEGDDADFSELVSNLKDTHSVWWAERFWNPVKTYSCPVAFFGELRVYIPSGGIEGQGLDLLGRRSTVTAEDFVSFLSELAQLTKDRVLGEHELKQALYAINQLTASTDQEYQEYLAQDLPLLSITGFLMPASQLLLDDAPWWRNRLRDLPWLSEKIDAGIAAACGVQRASIVVEEQLLSHSESLETDNRVWCANVEETLANSEFAAGVFRLVSQDHGPSATTQSAIAKRLALPVVACARIFTGLVCPAFELTRPVGRAETTCYVESVGKRPRILMASVDVDEVIPSLAQELNRRLGELAINNLAPLEAILRCKPEQIELRLDQRKIPRTTQTVHPPEYEWQEPAYSEDGFTTDGEEERQPDEPGSHDPMDDYSTGGSSEEKYEDSLSPYQSGPIEAERSATQRSFPSLPTGRLSSGTIDGGVFDSGNDALVIGPQINSGDATSRANLSPPLQPGVGQGSQSDRSASRMRSYVTPRVLSSGNSQAFDLDVKAAALRKVIIDVKNRQGEIVCEGDRTAGYDLEVLLSGDEQSRMISVKGLKGAWDARGVGLSSEEMKAAERFARRYSLVVVEFALDDAARLTELVDPATSIDEFRLDSGWRALGISLADSQTPAIGMTVSADGKVIGIIQGIESFGLGQYLTIVKPDGDQDKLYFDEDVHVLTQEPLNG